MTGRCLWLMVVLAVCALPCTGRAYDTPGSSAECREQFEAGRMSEAEVCLREGLEYEPENPYKLYLLAETIAADARRFAEAEEYYSRAFASAQIFDPPLVPEVLVSLGKLSIRLGDNDRALELLSDMISGWPDHYRTGEAYNVMGVALEKLDRFDEALDCFKRAITFDPDLLEAGYNMKNLQGQLERLNTGRYYLRMGDLDRAEDHFREAVESHQNYVAAWFMLGEVSERAGKTSEAIHCYLRVMALNPSYLGGKEPRYRTAEAYIDRGNEGDADEALKLLRGLSYKDSDVILGRTLIDLGRAVEAVGPLQYTALNVDLKEGIRAEAHYQLGRAYRALGSGDRATDEFFQALRLMPSVEKYRHPPVE